MADFAVSVTRIKSPTLSDAEVLQLVEACKQDVKKEITMRATSKRKITITLKKLKQLLSEEELSDDFLRNQITVIQDSLKDVEDRNLNVLSKYEQHGMLELDPGLMESEMESQTSYQFDVNRQLCVLQSKLSTGPEHENTSTQDHTRNSGSVEHDVRPPPLHCGTFSGESKNPFDFRTFMEQFNNVIDSNRKLTPSAKLTYLRGYLRGYAFTVIQHLSIVDSNYIVAIKLLTDEFMDTPFIIDETLKQLIALNPKFDRTYGETRVYLNEVRSLIHELKGVGLDFMVEGSPGCTLMSHIIYDKLPPAIKRELSHKVQTNYPTIMDIFDNYNEVIKTINRSSSAGAENTQKYSKARINSKEQGHTGKVKQSQASSGMSPEPGTLQSFQTSVNPSKQDWQTRVCKFCNIAGHSMAKCSKYETHASRVKRCQDLRLCTACSSTKHASESCPGHLTYECMGCQSKSHISALCPKNNKKHTSSSSNVCFNSQSDNKPYILPTISIPIGRGKDQTTARLLVDTGSQRSYISTAVADKLQLKEESLAPVECEVKTFISSGRKQFSETVLEVYLPGRRVDVPVLIDPDFELETEVSNLGIAVANIRESGITLADTAFHSDISDSIELDGIMGTDLIQFLPQFARTSCLKGSAFATSQGLLPFGHVEHFLNPSQIPRPYPEGEDSDPGVNGSAQVYDTHVHTVLHPRKSYFSIIEACRDDSQVEQGLEQMFSLESIGLPKEGQDVTDADRQVHEKFTENIEFSQGHYQVQLPWKEGMLESVPSSHKIALAVLDRVEGNLSKKGALDQYQQVFDQQLADGIIEEIQVHPSQYDKHTWIPHRPVFKTDEQATTKVRPVFNCSLKVNEMPSLNEAAFPGLDLMADLTQLLLIFRSESYVLLSDIKQAYLQIKLKEEADRNRFCFFLHKDGVLKMYRYTTIVFGFVSSSYILHNVIQHHASLYPDDQCTSALRRQMYVDNLIMTSPRLEELQWLYRETKRRMAEGGFSLRSWSSNHPDMQQLLQDEGASAQHGMPSEKVLGYDFSPDTDVLQLTSRSLDAGATTKRQILSEISKVFDPLGIFLPVTVRGRMLLRDLWIQKLGWDQEVPDSVKAKWQKLCAELIEIQSISFPRMAVQSSDTNSLFIFTDASKIAYGFTIYCLSGDKSTLMFAKAKMAPLSDKSIPALELLAVYLALKCLPTVLGAYTGIHFQKVVLSVDAQIVLSWIVGGEPKTKSVFIRNRIMDIATQRKRLLEDYSCDVLFRYVPTDENPADILTRGLSARELKEATVWCQGPTWLSHDLQGWPHHPLQCLSDESRAAVTMTSMATVHGSSNQPILELKRFSSFSKVVRVTALVFQFIHKLRKKQSDPEREARLYWVKQMQASSFADELEYLNQSVDTRITGHAPPLVNQLNLYIDEQGVLRSKGRISKSTHPHGVINPVMLGKDHFMTHLIIQDAHACVQHLGIQTVVTKVRLQGFWVPRIRQTVKKVLSRCMTCKKFNTLAFAYPKMTNMSKHQMKLVRPFAHCGVDYTGHLWVKDEKGESQKMYILIYTCLQVRAIHLDLVPDMTAKNFILSFQRFTNLYGIPSHLYSDNAKSYVTAGKMFQEALRSSEFEEFMKNAGIKHVLIPIYSAWIGSMWERMIRVVKSCLFKAVGRARLTYFELLTVLSNITRAVNSRPLTYRCSDDKDMEPITPQSFLMLQRNDDMLHIREDESDAWQPQLPTDDDLQHTIDVQEATYDRFRSLWHDEYLLSLREASRNLHQSDWSNRVKVGDVVLVKQPNKARPFWLLGYVLETIVGSDGKIRSVKIKRADGKLCHHSICHLYPLELTITHTGHEVQESQEQVPPQELHDTQTQHDDGRPVRRAAVKCRQLIRSKLADL